LLTLLFSFFFLTQDIDCSCRAHPMFEIY